MGAEEKLREQIARKYCAFERIRDYPSCYEDCPETDICPVGILTLLKEAGWMPVKPVQLEVLGVVERMNVDIPCEACGKKPEWGFPTVECMDCMAIRHQEAVVTHNEKKGQLYRRKE